MAKEFKENFVFGTATSSYQIEGAAAEDGRSPSIWDVFCKTPGKVYGGHNGDIACDHYHRYKEDVKLMSDIGVNAYRFSVSWPRIFPEKGKYNKKGMEFYKRLVNELCDKDIMPTVTLYHWDLPIWVYEMGGWLKRDSVKWFEEYAVKVFEELNDSVKLWITHNEPYCSSIYSYYEGVHAPGHKNSREALIVAHHILLSHGTAVEAFRKFNFKNSKIGITLNLTPSYPATGSKEDIEAASRSDGHSIRWFLDPIFKSCYPEDMKKAYKEFIGDFDFIRDGDLQKISIINDFLGVNYYSRDLIEFSKDSELNIRKTHGNFERTEMDWEIVPESLYDLIIRLRKEYTRIPIYITENGAAFNDRITKDGKVHDNRRIDYLRKHFKKVVELNQKGADIRGYFIWSLMDNFEWQHGYSKRFGIVFIDYQTQKRILKDSAIWYRDLIQSRVIK
ncbi:MAG: GH1 family beta-glucosidase [Candidatus Hydromicrobium sp.]|nr:GH1 family beta-glucosidase [Candidatus Hydromicrobium sp.]